MSFREERSCRSVSGIMNRRITTVKMRIASQNWFPNNEWKNSRRLSIGLSRPSVQMKEMKSNEDPFSYGGVYLQSSLPCLEASRANTTPSWLTAYTTCSLEERGA